MESRKWKDIVNGKGGKEIGEGKEGRKEEE